MASDIQPGAYVRCVGGMYAGATGRVVSVGQSASGPFASVDVGETHPIAVFVTGLELVGTNHSPLAELSRTRARVCEAARLIVDAIGSAGPETLEESARRIAPFVERVTAERDRMREGVEALAAAVATRLDALDRATCAHWPSADAVEYARSELSEVAEALRAILGR